MKQETHAREGGNLLALAMGRMSTKIYDSLVAVDDISFAMYRGEAFGFLGPNGAGKSTVVKILTGLVAPTRGKVRILGQPVSNLEMRRRIGYLPELPTF